MSDFYEDDEYPADVRAAFDRGPHGVTGSSGGARIVCGSGFANGGFVESHKDCRAALDAAQDEIEKLISEKETLRAERDMLKRGGEQLGKIIDRQGRDVIELTDSQDIIGEDGDGDWEVVWERLHDMKRERDQLGAALKFAAPIAYRMIIGGGA